MGILLICDKIESLETINVSYNKFNNVILHLSISCKNMIDIYGLFRILYNSSIEYQLEDLYLFFLKNKSLLEKYKIIGILYLLEPRDNEKYISFNKSEKIKDMIMKVSDNLLLTLSEELFLQSFTRLLMHSILYKKHIYIY